MEIRSIQSDDFEAWSSLWDGYNSFYKRIIPNEVTQNTWKRFLEPHEPVHALVAEVDGQIVGFTAYLFHRHTALINDVCYLQDLFTHEEFRGRGIAKALILEVSKKAKEVGSAKVYWMTHEENRSARALYDKIAKHSGFLVYSRKT